MHYKSGETILIRYRKGHAVTKKRDTCVDGSRDYCHKPRNAGVHQKLEEVRKDSTLETCSPANILISDFWTAEM